MNSFLSLEQPFSLLVYQKVLLVWVTSTVKFSLLPNKVSVKMCFFTACMSLRHNSINYGSCIYLYTWISHVAVHTLEDGVMNSFIQVSSRVWHIINCWTFVDDKWMKDEGGTISSPCRMLSAWGKETSGEESVETSREEVFPLNAWDKGWVSVEQPKEQSGEASLMLKESFSHQIHLGREAPSVEQMLVKAEGQVSHLPSPGA